MKGGGKVVKIIRAGNPPLIITDENFQRKEIEREIAKIRKEKKLRKKENRRNRK